MTAKLLAGAKTILLAWVIAGGTTFGVLEKHGAEVGDAAWAAGLTGLAAAAIAGLVKVLVTLISTSRNRRDGRERERQQELARMRDACEIEKTALRDGFASERKAFLLQTALTQHQLLSELTINKLKTSSKHSLISDIGARDHYIDYLLDLLREARIPFDKSQFRNTAEASAKEDEQVQEIVQAALKTLMSGIGLNGLKDDLPDADAPDGLPG